MGLVIVPFVLYEGLRGHIQGLVFYNIMLFYIYIYNILYHLCNVCIYRLGCSFFGPPMTEIEML